MFLHWIRLSWTPTNASEHLQSAVGSTQSPDYLGLEERTCITEALTFGQADALGTSWVWKRSLIFWDPDPERPAGQRQPYQELLFFPLPRSNFRTANGWVSQGGRGLSAELVPEGRASITYLVIGPFPGSPLDQWIVIAEPYLEMKGSPGGPGAPGNQERHFQYRNRAARLRSK